MANDHEDKCNNHSEAPTTISESRLMWKIDLWILPTLTVLFLFSFIDK